MKIVSKIFSATVILFICFSCSFQLPFTQTSEAKLGQASRAYNDLTTLPGPKEKIVCAVYKFRDQTGQYKTSASGATWSTAVTQGATSILNRALEESGWFMVIEREGLSNLLNERKIIRSSRANYTDDQGKKLQSLPPLLYAGVILEGGIVSYDSNIMTGGLGAKYFGLGGSTQYRQDRITIYLRAVSTQNGRVLKTVYTTKTILSHAVDVGFYRFIEFKRLLEAEGGYSYNEPIQICVTEAIEKAVHSMIIEGVLDNLWELKDPENVKTVAFQQYFEEKEAARKSVYYAETKPSKRNGVTLGLNAAGLTYTGDFKKTDLRMGGDFYLKTGLTRNFSLTANAGMGKLSSQDYFDTDMYFGELKSQYYFYPQRDFSPFLTMGAMLLNFYVTDKNGVSYKNVSNQWRLAFVSGGGIDYMLSDVIGINLGINHHYVFSDLLDGKKHGKYNDQFWGSRLGFMIYLNN